MPIPGRVFIAGAGGVVGSRLCRLLVGDGWSVTGTTRLPAKTSALRDLGVTPVVVDVFDAERLNAVVAEARPAIVVHQLTDLPPGLDPTKMAESVVRNARLRDEGTRHLVAAALAAGVKRIVAQSVAFAYLPGPMPYREDSPLNVNDPDRAGVTARGVASLEGRVLAAPLEGVILRYGKLYGPNTGFDSPAGGGALHVDAAADAARRALNCAVTGIFNIAEEDGTVSSRKATQLLGWTADFRIQASRAT